MGQPNGLLNLKKHLDEFAGAQDSQLGHGEFLSRGSNSLWPTLDKAVRVGDDA
jgi:hypothetical protein